MSSNIGLYYPFIEFQDEAWIRLAVLYWDKIGRIVPPDYNLHDSETVQRLEGDLDFIKNFKPTNHEMNTVAVKFHDLLRQHRRELINSYGVSLKAQWTSNPIAVVEPIFKQTWPTPEELLQTWKTPSIQQQPDPKLTYLFYAGKMSLGLVHDLINSGLALRLEIGKGSPLMVGLHPKLAYIYMEALAEEMATMRQLHLVTESVLDHLAISGCTLERLVQVLLTDTEESQATCSFNAALKEQEMELQMAMIALSTVLPRHIESIPIEKIIKFRKHYSDELGAFQAYLHEFVTSLNTLEDIKDRAALQAHLEVEYEKGLKPQLRDLKECLRSLGVETVVGAMNIRVALPALVASGGAYLSQAHLGQVNPLLAGAGAIAFSLLPMIQDKRKLAKDKMRSSPAAYLLHVEEGLKPAQLTFRIAQSARKFFFRI